MRSLVKLVILAVVSFASAACISEVQEQPVDYVNPNIGGISHLLVPTYPTVHLPNSMLRMVPSRTEYTCDFLEGLSVMLTGHRGEQAFRLSPWSGDIGGLKDIIRYEYDNEKVYPYHYSVYLEEPSIEVEYAPSFQAAAYSFDFRKKENDRHYVVLNSQRGYLSSFGKTSSGYYEFGGMKVFIFMEFEQEPIECLRLDGDTGVESHDVKDGSLVFVFREDNVKLRYGVSFISEEQAKYNLRREIEGFDIGALAISARNIWNEALSKIKVLGASDNEKSVFYTALYRIYERMINISEDGKYYSAYDCKIHHDDGVPFYVDDWLWDTYRAVHPLRTLIEPAMETDMVSSFIRIAEQSGDMQMPNFPGVAGDSHSMNSNHGVAVVADCYAKGLRGFDIQKAYDACKNAITEKTLAPWSGAAPGRLDSFYWENGYFPALENGEQETEKEIHSFERRQPVAVTLGTVYDEWCLSQVAHYAGRESDAEYFRKRSLNYRKIFNKETLFFHPKDKNGNFIQPFDYTYSGGIGARNAYDENNGWIYRWEVQHNIKDLIECFGGREKFVEELEMMFDTPLGKSKYEFYTTLPDHTGNVGQYSMGNEPSLHIPYLYNYAGKPWMTQKRTRKLLDQWFRDDYMGVPGDEDGGGLSAFVVFTMMGFYPVTPGLPIYVMTSPVFETVKVDVGHGKCFTIKCEDWSAENKYIQSATLNGEKIDRSWLSHLEIVSGGKLELQMGRYPNKQWAVAEESCPPSFQMNY